MNFPITLFLKDGSEEFLPKREIGQKAADIFKNVIQKSKSRINRLYFKPVIREADYYIAYNFRLNGNLDSAKIYFLDCANFQKKLIKKKNRDF